MKSYYHPYARQLYDMVKDIQPCAKVVMHQTWSYRSDSEKFTQTGVDSHAKNSQEMWESLRDAYKTVASELDVEIVQVGKAFWRISSNRKWKFKGDSSFNEAKAVYPELPIQENSLHNGYYWDDEKEIHFDTHHANDAGRFLGSLVWYAYLFKESPRKLNYVPENVPEKFAVFLKKTAWKVSK